MLKKTRRACLGLDNLESREVCATLLQLGTLGDIVGVLSRNNTGGGLTASATGDPKPIANNQRHIYYSVLSVQNTTASPIRFMFRWDGSPVARQYLLAPGKTMRFASKQIETVNPDKLATITVHGDTANPKQIQTYQLNSRLVQANANGGLPSGPGQTYLFQKSDTGIVLNPEPPVIN